MPSVQAQAFRVLRCSTTGRSRSWRFLVIVVSDVVVYGNGTISILASATMFLLEVELLLCVDAELFCTSELLQVCDRVCKLSRCHYLDPLES